MAVSATTRPLSPGGTGACVGGTAAGGGGAAEVEPGDPAGVEGARVVVSMPPLSLARRGKSILTNVTVDAPHPPRRRAGVAPTGRAARHRVCLRQPRAAAPHRRRRRPRLVVRPGGGRRPRPPGTAPLV